MRLVFAGTPPFAAAALRALHEAGHDIAAILTQPDRPAGRGMKLRASAVKQWASEHGVETLQPRGLRLDGRWSDDAARAEQALRQAAPDVIVVAAYGLILPQWVLDLPRLGCLNIHASLLPRWRGAAPIQRAIEAGDPCTGITIMQMDAGLDTGDILLARQQEIRPDDTAASLQDRLAAQGAALIVEALARLQAGSLRRTPQPAEGETYARKIDKAEAAIDWTCSAQAIERRVRAFDPVPGATAIVAGQATKIWRTSVAATAAQAAAPGTIIRCDPQVLHVACGEGQLSLCELQSAGARRMPASQFLQSAIGRRLRPGTRLAEPAIEG